MPGKITSSETVALVRYQDRWLSVTADSGKPLMDAKPGYADQIKIEDDYAFGVKRLYDMCLQISQEEVVDLLTMPKYFVLALLVHQKLDEMIARYDPDNYRLDEQKTLLLRQLFDILQRIRHILAHDRNQVIDQVLSFCRYDTDDPFTDFCTTLKRLFDEQWLTPMPAPGFLKRAMVRQVLIGHQKPVKGARVFHNNTLLVSIDARILIIWRISDGTQIRHLDLDGKLEPTALEVIEEQQVILAVFREGVAITWQWRMDGNRPFLHEIAKMKDERAFLDLRYYKDSTVAIASTKGYLLLWDFLKNTTTFVPTGIDSLHSVTVLPDEDLIVSGGSHFGDSAFMVFKVLKGETWSESYCSPAHDWPVDQTHAAGGGLVLSRSNATVSLYDTGKNKLLFQKDCGRTLHSSGFIPGKQLLLVTGSNTIHTLDVKTGEGKKLVTGHHGMINDILIEEDGKMIVTASEDQTVRIWNGDLLLDNMSGGETHSDYITFLTAVDEWNCFISASRDGKLILWDTRTCLPVKTIAAHKHWVSGIQCLKEQAEFLSYSWDGYVNFWDVTTFEKTRFVYLEGKHITWLHYHQGLEKFLFSEYDKTLWIYDIRERSLTKVDVPEKPVRCFYQEGNDYWLITETGDVLAFNYSSGVAVLPVMKLDIDCADAYFQQPYLFIADREGTLYRWDNAKKESNKLTRMPAVINGLVIPENRGGNFLTITGRPHYLSDNTLRIHDFTGNTLNQFTVESPLTSCAYSLQNEIVGLGDIAGGIYFFRLNNVARMERD